MCMSRLGAAAASRREGAGGGWQGQGQTPARQDSHGAVLMLMLMCAVGVREVKDCVVRERSPAWLAVPRVVASDLDPWLSLSLSSQRAPADDRDHRTATGSAVARGERAAVVGVIIKDSGMTLQVPTEGGRAAERGRRSRSEVVVVVVTGPGILTR